MKKMTLAGCLAIGMTTGGYAATEFPDGRVPVELVHMVAGGDYYSSLPDNFPLANLDVNPSLNLRVIGSVQQGTYNTRVLLRSGATAATTQASLDTALKAKGWAHLPLPYVSAEQRYCHDQHGDLRLGTRDVPGDDARVTVTLTNLPPGYPFRESCAQQLAAAQGEPTLSTFLFDLMPVLENPPGTIPSNVPPGGFISRGSSSSGGRFQFNNEGRIEVPDTNVAEVHAHFIGRMVGQQWLSDAVDAGERSAASIWFRTVTLPDSIPAQDREVEAVVNLTVVAEANDIYRVTLTLHAEVATPPPVLVTPIGLDAAIRDCQPVPALGIRSIPPVTTEDGLLNDPVTGSRFLPICRVTVFGGSGNAQ